jgi:transcriptional regulator with XRE-family HTH domain
MTPMTEKQTARQIGTTVKRRRAELQLSLQYLAKATGTYASNIKRIEEAETVPGTGLLTRLCEALGVTPNEILGFEKKELSRAS